VSSVASVRNWRRRKGVQVRARGGTGAGFVMRRAAMPVERVSRIVDGRFAEIFVSGPYSVIIQSNL